MTDSDAPHTGQRFGVLLELGTAFIAVAFVLSLAWQTPGPIVLDVGPRSDEAPIYLTDPDAPQDDGQRNYRWVRSDTDLTFPGLGVSDWRVSLVAAAGARPDGARVPLMIRAGDTVVFHTPQAEPDFHRYDFQVPASAMPTGDLSLTLNIAEFTPPNDQRVLGMAIDRIELDASFPVVPAPTTLLALAGAVTWLYALLRFFSRRYAIVGTGLAALLAGIMVGWQRLLITPYTLKLILVGALLYVGVYLMRGILRRYLPEGSPDSEEVPDRGHAAPIFALVISVALLYALADFGREALLRLDNPAPVDFRVYHEASGRLLDGEPLYDLATLQENPFTAVYKYPPLLPVMLEPLAALPENVAFKVWQFLNLGAIAVGLFAMLRARGRQKAESSRHKAVTQHSVSAASILLIVVTLLFRPLFDTLFSGQVEALVFAGFALVYWALKSGRPSWVGLPLAAISLLKLYPALLVIYLVMRREWKALASFALWVVALVALTLPFVGVASWWTYLTQVLPLSGGGTASAENQAFAGFFARLWTDQLGLLPLSLEPGWLDPLVNSVGYSWLAFVLGMSYWFARRLPARPSPGYDLGFATFVIACVLALPVVWYHYITVLLVPLGILFFTLEDHASRITHHVSLIALLALATVLLTYGGGDLVWSGGDPTGWWRITLSYKLYGMVLLWVCSLMFCRAFAKPAVQSSA